MVNSTRSTPVELPSMGSSSEAFNSTLDDEPAYHPTLIHNYNHTTPKIFHGISGIGIDPGILGGSGIFTSPGAGVIGQGKLCLDLHGRKIPSGVHYVPGPDECTLCVCEDGGPKWCKAVLCSPPMDCSSFRVGNSCCEFICLDDTLNKKGGGAKTGGGFNGPFDVGDVVPKIIVVAITAILSLSLLLFLIHRLRQKQIQGRLNSSVARRCDDCDESRSLDFSMDYFVDRGPPPPPYLAWWKPPSTYFPPRGEAPPPYEEAIASTSNCLPMTFTAAYTNAAAAAPLNNVTSSSTVSPTCVINPNGIATTTLITASTVATVSAEPDSSSPSPREDSNQEQGARSSAAELPGSSSSAGPSVVTFRKDSSGAKSKKRNFKSISKSSDPQPGPSCTRRRLNETEDIIRRSGGSLVGGSSVQLYPQHLSNLNMQVPPTYDDSVMEVPYGSGRQYFRHSLSLPRRGGGGGISDHQPLDHNNASHPFCPRIGTVGGSGGCSGGRHNSTMNQEAQRYSLQFHIADHCWSSASSSTLSLSTPNSPNGLSVRPPSLSSSSSSNVSNTHHV